MAYSKELEQQNKVLGDLLAGREPEKRILVGYKSKQEKKEDVESDLTKLMQDVRMPWFCPECKRVMKKRIDDKMWKLFSHCFECQVEKEHKMRVEGTFEQYEKTRIVQNKIGLIQNTIDELKDWLREEKTEYVEPVNVNTGFVHIEKFEKPKNMLEEAKNALVDLEKKKIQFEELLSKVENGDD